MEEGGRSIFISAQGHSVCSLCRRSAENPQGVRSVCQRVKEALERKHSYLELHLRFIRWLSGGSTFERKTEMIGTYHITKNLERFLDLWMFGWSAKWTIWVARDEPQHHAQPKCSFLRPSQTPKDLKSSQNARVLVILYVNEQ